MQITRTQKSLLKFQNKKLYEYHDFYVQNEKLLLTNVLENFLNICLKIHELDPAVNGRERYQRQNMPCYPLICKS